MSRNLAGTAAPRRISGRAGAAFEISLDPLIRDLHEAAARLALADFPRWALARLRDQVGFTRATWSTRAAQDEWIHRLVQFGAPPLPGSGVAHTEIAGGNDMCAHSLDVDCACAETGRQTLIRLERVSTAREFAVAERRTLQRVAPHLSLAWNTCQRIVLLERAAGATGCGVALVDAEGLVHSAVGPFYAQVRCVAPGWFGHRLPEPLLQLIGGIGSGFVGGTRWSVEHCGALLLLQGQPLGALSRLTARETTVVAALLAGESYDGAAQGLGISVNTLRHAVARVYRKLGVNTRFELLGRFEPKTLHALLG